MASKPLFSRNSRSATVGCSILASGAIGLDGQGAIEVLVCRHQQQREYLAGWRLAYRRNSRSSHMLAARMDPGNETVRDFLVLSRSAIAQLPLFIKVAEDEVLARFRYNTLASVDDRLASII